MRHLLRDQQETMTGDFTVDPLTPLYFIDASLNSLTVTLPSPTVIVKDNKQARVQLKRIDAVPANIVTVVASGALVEGAQNRTIVPGQSITFFSDGINYYVTAGAPAPIASANNAGQLSAQDYKRFSDAVARLDGFMISSGSGTISSILLGGNSVDVTIPITPQMPNINYRVNLTKSSATLSLGNLDLSVKSKNAVSVIVTAKNTASAALPAGTIIDVIAYLP